MTTESPDNRALYREALRHIEERLDASYGDEAREVTVTLTPLLAAAAVEGLDKILRLEGLVRDA